MPAVSHLGVDGAGSGEWDLTKGLTSGLSINTESKVWGSYKPGLRWRPRAAPQKPLAYRDRAEGVVEESGCEHFPQASPEPLSPPLSHPTVCFSFHKTSTDTTCDIMTYNREYILDLHPVPGTNPKTFGIS